MKAAAHRLAEHPMQRIECFGKANGLRLRHDDVVGKAAIANSRSEEFLPRLGAIGGPYTTGKAGRRMRHTPAATLKNRSFSAVAQLLCAALI